jgi:hypothetical protein
MFIIRAEDMSILNGIFKVLNRIKDFDLISFSLIWQDPQQVSLSLSLSLFFIEEEEPRKLAFHIKV